ncbi:amino acid kinase [Candidatus Thorarchaeota archaeon]|nr:MAG: amino acid kinase [Candidatus Thorarchaeota archaeon]
MKKELTVIKLGGSLLTDKSKPYTPRKSVIESTAREIKVCLDDGLIESLVIVHGVGSFGHPPVLEHKLHMGFKDPKQLLPLSKTQHIVNEFRLMLTEAFHKVGLPVNLLHPSSMIVAEKMKFAKVSFEPLKGWLSIGTIPLLGGDVLYDSVMGFSIGSGDILAVELANQLEAKRLIFAMDVAGIYDDNPQTNPDASLICDIDIHDIARVLEGMQQLGRLDASGAMKGKLASVSTAMGLIEEGLETTLLSMMDYGNLIALLKGQEIDCTRIISR